MWGFTTLLQQGHRDGRLDLLRNEMPIAGWPQRGELVVNVTRHASEGRPDAEQTGDVWLALCRQIMAFAGWFRQSVPGCARAYVATIGNRVGVRESWRVQGHYTLTQHDVQQGAHLADSIACGGFPVDIHCSLQPGRSHTDAVGRGVEIAYRSLLPLTPDNLLVAGRCLSSDHAANGSLRITATCFATGEAAGVAAALIFNHLFFPQLSLLSGTLATFASYGVGFLVRPLGGLFWGDIGDKYGRRPVLIGTLVLMGVSTTAIGLLPGYGSIGFAAPLLLTLLRLLQGFGAGAEFSSAITLNTEKASAHRRGYYASWSGVGIGCGVLLSASAFALAQQLPQASFIAWGWRIPFLLSILAVLVGGAIRLYVTESPIFNKLEQRHKVVRAPFITVWQTPSVATFSSRRERRWRKTRRVFSCKCGVFPTSRKPCMCRTWCRSRVFCWGPE